MTKPPVLVADDDEATCALMTALLSADCDVEIAQGGAEAIEKLKTRRFASVLLDLRMRGVDGYAVLDFLAAERADLLSRVLVVTASLSPRDLDRVGRYAVRGMIPKPFEIESLKRHVQECIGETGNPPIVPLVSGGMLLLLADLLGKVR